MLQKETRSLRSHQASAKVYQEVRARPHPCLDSSESASRRRSPSRARVHDLHPSNQDSLQRRA